MKSPWEVPPEGFEVGWGGGAALCPSNSKTPIRFITDTAGSRPPLGAEGDISGTCSTCGEEKALGVD